MLTVGMSSIAAMAAGTAIEPSGASLLWTSDDPTVAKARALVNQGELAQAEKLLEQAQADASPELARACRESKEIIRRIRMDYSQSFDELVQRIRRNLPDVTVEEVERWRDAGQVQYRVLDGKKCYFSREPSNIWLFCQDAKQRRARHEGRELPRPGQPTEKEKKLMGHLKEIIAAAERTGQAQVLPIKHTIKYRLTVDGDRPGAKVGSVLRCWLPFAQEYRQQSQVKLLSASPGKPVIAPNVVEGWPLGGAAQRTVYLEHKITDPAQPVEFAVDFEYVSRAYYPQLDDAKAKPLPADYHGGFLAERPPHVVFTPLLKSTVRKIIGDETNPLRQARAIFRWISKNRSWCAEQQYSIIPNISDKLLSCDRGDCGTHGMLFVALCRSVGIPARWQSGWETVPWEWNMHDWAECYIEPWGWLPVDTSYGLKPSDDPRVHEFYFGHQDAYRLIVNQDYGSPLHPPKQDLRSETVDFQLGEVEMDGRNLYYDEWSHSFQFDQQKLED